MRHQLKTWPPFFSAVLEGRKTFEARLDDRDFSVHDVLALNEWEPNPGRYTGRSVERVVTYILRGPAFGVEAGHVIMALGMPDAPVAVDE